MTGIARILAVTGQLAIGLVFALSALPKLRRPAAFARNVRAYEILPDGTVRAAAAALLALETALAAGLIAGWPTDPALVVAAGLVCVFAGAVVVNLRRGRDISCGCFGDSAERISVTTVVRLGMLLAVVVLAIVLRGVSGRADDGLLAVLSGRLPAADLVSAALLAVLLVVLGTWALHWPQLSDLARTRGLTGES